MLHLGSTLSWRASWVIILNKPTAVFSEEVIQCYPWFTDRAGGPRQWFPWGQGVSQEQDQEQSPAWPGSWGGGLLRSLALFLLLSPSESPAFRGWEALQSHIHSSDTHPPRRHRRDVSLSCSPDRPCWILLSVSRLREISLYFCLCACMQGIHSMKCNHRLTLKTVPFPLCFFWQQLNMHRQHTFHY